jgi:hypothetical protein
MTRGFVAAKYCRNENPHPESGIGDVMAARALVTVVVPGLAQSRVKH